MQLFGRQFNCRYYHKDGSCKNCLKKGLKLLTYTYIEDGQTIGWPNAKEQTMTYANTTQKTYDVVCLECISC